MIGRLFNTATLLSLMVAALAVPTQAQECQKDNLAVAVDKAGDQLRVLTKDTQPKIEAAMRQLKVKRGWSEADYEEKSYEALQDDKVTAFDTSANELLAKIDALGQSGASATVPCNRIADVEAAGIELQATIRAKTKYVLARLEILSAPVSTPGSSAGSGVSNAPADAVAAAPPKQALIVDPPGSKPAAKTGDAKSGTWSTTTAQSTQSQAAPGAAPGFPGPWVTPPPGAAPPPLPTLPRDALMLPPDDKDPGYTIDEIQAASEGAFGKVSAGIGGLLEHAFRQSGRPSAYILGSEGGGAFVAGLRYGSGTLYLRAGGSMPIYWHGPSVGTDFGASGSKTMFLIYRLRDAEDLIASFTGVDGSAYVVGGLGLTFMSNGRIQLAPIRSGLGLRLGANIGYVRFTRKPTWNPF